MVGSELHSCNLDIHGRGVDVLGQCQRHVQAVDAALSCQVQKALARLDITIVFLQVDLLRQPSGNIHVGTLQVFGVSNLAIADEVVDTPVAEQLINTTDVALRVVGIALAHAFIDTVLGVDFQVLELYANHHGEAQGTPFHTPLAFEALCCGTLDLVDGQFILSDIDHLVSESACSIVGRVKVGDSYLTGTLEVFLRQMLRHRQVQHVDGVGGERHRLAIDTLGFYAENDVVTEIHDLLDILPRNGQAIVLIFFHFLAEDGILGQRGGLIHHLSAVEELNGIGKLQRVRLLTGSAEMIDAIPLHVDVLAHKQLAGRGGVGEVRSRNLRHTVGVFLRRVDGGLDVAEAEDSFDVLFFVPVSLFVILLVVLLFLVVIHLVRGLDAEELQVAAAVVLNL